MKKLLLKLLAVSVLVFFFCLDSNAQDKDQIVLLHIEHVKPSKAMQYEKASKAMMAMLQEHKIESISYTASMGEDFTYSFAVALENMAALDKPFWGEAVEKIGEDKWKEAMKEGENCVESSINRMYLLSNDLSYTSSTTQNTKDQNFYRSTSFYFKNDKEQKAMKLVKKWKEWHTKKNSPATYIIGIGSIGTEEPMIVMLESAASSQELHNRNDKVKAMMDEEANELWQKTLEITRKMEVKEGVWRPDLSYKYKKDASIAEKN